MALPGVGPGDHTITLISGDKVKLINNGDGRFAWQAEPATRPDGRIPLLQGESGPDGDFVIPDDARPAVDAGILDRTLFDIRYLAANGYADDATRQLPLIVQYPKDRADGTLRATAAALPASTPGLTLESINANALTVPKVLAAAFWSAITGRQAQVRALAGGIRKVWLDQKVTADLDESVPLIGAPKAWAAGHDGTGVKVAVLDTGIDDTHPDLAGKVAGAKSFLPGETSTKDGHGHGTHVASTIVGSGAAAGGLYKGVAPGAQLLVGKVLGDSGSGSWVGIIEGMEWAATAGAKVVSMSLGSGPTDGTDLASQAVNDLTASTGTLFVIAAGNDGPSKETVSSPGAADAALTVAATTKTDTMANFSSRGPRIDYAMKPDIAAPGVDIAAARAAGTSMGTPVDANYTTASGTSMATPHVAGAAAILAQLHPDWTAGQYKAALMSTSKDDGFTVYEQGAGRLDVARAASQQVYASTPNVDYADVNAGQPPSDKDLTYSNLGDQPVTLTLAPSLRNTNGDPTADGVLTVPGSVTLPAGGTATVTVTADTAQLDEGAYSGSIVATDDTGSVRLSTPVGLMRQPPGVTVDINVPNLPSPVADGAQAKLLYSMLDVAGDRGPISNRIQILGPGRARVVVPQGTYSFSVRATWVDVDQRTNLAYLLNPEVTVTGDTEVTLDGLQAQELTFSSPHGPLEVFPYKVMTMQTERTVLNKEVWASWFSAAPYFKFWVNPTQQVTKGKFLFGASLDLGHPEVQLSVTAPVKTTLHPVNEPHYGDVLNGGLADYRPFTGKRTLSLVDVGHASKEEIAELDLRGKLALLDNDRPCNMHVDQVHNVRDAGAAGIVAWSSTPQNTNCGGGPTIPIGIKSPAADQDRTVGIPFTSISPVEGKALLNQLAQGPVTIAVTGTPESPYHYLVHIRESGGVPSSLHFPLGDRQVARVDMEIHGTASNQFAVSHASTRPDQWVNLLSYIPVFAGSGTRTVYVGPLYDKVAHRLQVQGPNDFEQRYLLADQPTRTLMRWNTGLKTPGSTTAPPSVVRLWDPSAEPRTQPNIGPCYFCRQSDAFAATFTRTHGDGRFGTAWVAPSTTHLFRNGVEVPKGGPITYPFTLPKEEADYRLTLREGNNSVEWTYRSATVTEDTRQVGHLCLTEVYDGYSGPCRPEPLVFVSYDLGASQALDNTVAAGRRHSFVVNARHSPSRAAMPKIAGVKLWTSTDDGASWRPATIRPNRDGTYTAAARYPKYADTTGTVSLKVEAWDAAGSRIVQTTAKAFPLRPDPTHPGR